MCVCVCVCVYIYTHTHTYIYIYIYIYIYVLLCSDDVLALLSFARSTEVVMCLYFHVLCGEYTAGHSSMARLNH